MSSPRAVAGRGARWERRAVIAAAIYAAVYLSWTALHWAGDRTTVSDVASWAVLVGAITVALRRAYRMSGRSRLAWACIAAGCSSWLLAEVLWFVFEVVLHTTPFPSVADAFYLGFFPLVFAGLVAMPVQEPRARDRLTLLLDSAVVVVTAVMAIWYLVIDPQISVASGSVWAKALSLAYPAGDVLLLFGVVRVLLRRPRRSSLVSLRVLGSAIGCMVVADVAFAHLDLQGSYQNGSFPDALWVVSIFLVMLAAYLAGDQAEAVPGYVAPSRRVSIVPYAAVFVALGLLVYQAANPSAGSLLSLSIGVFVLAGLVVARQIALAADVTRLIGELEYLAGTDPLTGLASRRAFFEQGSRLVTLANNDGHPCAVLISDLNSFKDVNDLHGHAVGDAVLRAAARRCQEATGRTMGAVGRIGGDEFAFVLSECDHERATQFTTELAELVRGDASVVTDRAPIQTRITFGVAISDGSSGLDELLLAADADLYRAKAMTGDRKSGISGSPMHESTTRRSVTRSAFP